MGKVWLVALLLVGVMADAWSQAAPPVKVGFSIARTGIFAAGTQTSLNSYELWAERVNAGGGLDVKGTKRPVQLVWHDDQSDASKSAQIYEKLITSDKVDLLIGPWGSPANLAIAGVVERHQFPTVVGSASSVKLREIKAGNIFFTSMVFPDKLGQTLPDLLKANGYKSAAVLTVQVPYTLEIKSFLVPNLKKAGIDVKVDEGYPPTVKDMTALLLRVKEAAPEAVIVLSFPADTAIYMNQARETGINAPFQFNLIGPTREWFPKQFGAHANGMVTIGSWHPNKAEWSKAKPFYDAYTKKFNEKPDYSDAILGYMACEVLEEAVRIAGLDKDALRKTLASATFETLTGPVKFSGVENVATPTGLSQYQNGQLEIVWPPNIATAKLIRKTAAAR
jgi:branched-chain amino acid transport system substrate-binding protein